MRHTNSGQRCGFLLLLLIFLSGCAGTHIDTMRDVQQELIHGNYQRAEDLIVHKEKLQQSKNEALYALEYGIVAHLSGKYAESNRLFEQAVMRMETLKAISITETATEWILTEKTQPYQGEDFEQVIVHYYMALNYLMLGDLQGALVECRRVNTLLRELNDRYEHTNVYKTDAFSLYLSGILYDAMGEVNDAFIDYRNAYNAYREDYQEYYGTPVPEQLKHDLLRTASALGFHDVLHEYQQTFGIRDWPTQQAYRQAARLVVIWENGQIPYKVEKAYRQYVELNDKKDAGCYLKFAFPEFVTRIPNFSQAIVSVGKTTQTLDLAEDLAQIAIKNLEDRRLRTLAKAAVRNALKCATEYEIEKKNQILGWLFGGLTELTEGADTRQWVLLPANIQIAHLLVEPGIKDVELSFSGIGGQFAFHRVFEQIRLEPGKTTFLIHRTF
ncbi:MAG: hypothetical protein RBT80_02200 [Candidatus Vecturithrix sp.]|jgi:hypothetical protein|nr:hypothetical protein [Candidatus Vecturithrix sp.]